MSKSNQNTIGTKQTRKDRAILALLQHATIEKAAEAAGVHPSSLYRWMKQPDFRDKLIQARNVTFSQSVALFQQAVPMAVSRLVRIATKPDTTDCNAIRACDSILTRAEKSFHNDMLEARVSRLEKRRDQQPDQCPE
jgi:transposase-like protein